MKKSSSSNSCSSFTDGWLGVVAGNVMEPDAVVVEVVEDGQAELIALAVVRLWNSTTERKNSFR